MARVKLSEIDSLHLAETTMRPIEYGIPRPYTIINTRPSVCSRPMYGRTNRSVCMLCVRRCACYMERICQIKNCDCIECVWLCWVRVFVCLLEPYNIAGSRPPFEMSARSDHVLDTQYTRPGWIQHSWDGRPRIALTRINSDPKSIKTV